MCPYQVHNSNKWTKHTSHTSATMFTTERLILRAYREEDVDETLKMWNDLTIQQLTAIDHVVPRGPNQKQEVRSWFEKNRLHVILEDKASGSYVGFMAIEDQNPKNRDGEFGITIKPEFTNKGYGTEVLRWAIDYAFKGLNLHRLWLKSFGHNERAIHVYKKLGFVEEGRLRKANWVDGRWVDVVIMSILDEEWWDSHKNE
ncbi:acyl-CoA N-acyltransferase [Abortiporus biennis]|nr:acyl-CoA N-acyltransferase [Abortiporus biennis]